MRGGCVSGHVVRESFRGLDKLGEMRQFVSLGVELLEAGELLAFPRNAERCPAAMESTEDKLSIFILHTFSLLKVLWPFLFIYLIKLI